jgi:8-oxo-dGTP pyrophosphatase MutT (NUDIX family)
VNDTALARRLADPLTGAQSERRWPNLRPKNAATLIIIDRTGREPKVLMGRRHAGHKFMPGKFVFPGGRIELGDRHMPVAGALHPRAEAALAHRVTRPPHNIGRALALAAIRETFEETGLLLGTKEHGAPDNTPEGPWRAFRERGVMPDLDALQFVGRAITPPRRPKRFDTRFFAADRRAIADETPGVVGPDSELVELTWVTLKDAQDLDLPRITAAMLEELRQRLAQGFGPDLPVPFYFMRHNKTVREVL